MQLIQFKTLDAGRDVQGFLDSQAAAVGILITPALRARLDHAVAQLGTYQIQQGLAAGTAVGETSHQAVVRQDIYDRFMKPIGRIAKDQLRGVTDFAHLVVPAVLLNGGRVGEFYVAANKLASAAAPFAQVLVANGLPADFIAQLQAAIGQLDASAGSRSVHLGTKANATKGLAEMDTEIRTVIGIIDGVLTAFFKANPALKAQWLVSKRIAKTVVNPNPTGSPGGSTGSVSDTPTPPSTAPAAPSAGTPVLSIADGTKAAA